MKQLTAAACRAFRNKIYGYFKANGRDFSWRRTTDPYAVFVSEIMLQQTQTSRVEEKFPLFIAAFPTFKALAEAPLAEVLKLWQGMGYNRRALYLQKAAQAVAGKFGGRLPQTIEELESLPGIGPATARSIAAFGFNMPVPFIETNIRAVYIHEFFKDKQGVTDAELLPLVEQTLDRENARKWYNALMDYGVMLKSMHPNPSRRSAHYVRHSPFESSDRRVRGQILKLITVSGPHRKRDIHATLAFDKDRIDRCLKTLLKDGLLRLHRNKYQI